MVPWMRLSAAQAWQNTNPGVLSTEMTRGHERRTLKKQEKVIKQCFQYVDYLAISCNILQSSFNEFLTLMHRPLKSATTLVAQARSATHATLTQRVRG
jgi:hypothetical protein